MADIQPEVPYSKGTCKVEVSLRSIEILRRVEAQARAAGGVSLLIII